MFLNTLTTGAKMKAVNTLIKWPGGKAREIKYIKHLIPNYDRYIEPFFGGGAMFFYLKPDSAVINDISSDLIDFYSLVKEQNLDFKATLMAFSTIFDNIISSCETHYNELLAIYDDIKQGDFNQDRLQSFVNTIFDCLSKGAVNTLVFDNSAFKKQLYSNALDKMRRTVKNELKAPFNAEDLRENLITGFTGGTYMYFRDIYNDILLKRNSTVSKEYRAANFYFIREYCYGSMFRYNSKGEFNIPYGGMSYNRKDFKTKINDIFCKETQKLFSGTDIHCQDFEEFFSSVELAENDFIFLDPPYDTDFSDYEGKDFTKEDQRRLAETLKKTKAKFILIIKNTDFIYSLYDGFFNILCFDKTYTYNVRSRNERNVKHLIITNISV